MLALLLDATFSASWEVPVRPASQLCQERSSLLRWVSARSQCVPLCQVPLRTYFTLPAGVLLDADAGVVTSNSTEFNYVNAHVHDSELYRLRTRAFEPLLQTTSKLVVRCNGAVW